MSVNKDWPADQWQAWFERCIQNIKQFDTHAAGSSDHSLGPLPDDDDFNSAACQVLFRPNWPDQQSDIASVRTAATEGQKDLGKKQWEILAPLSERDVLAIVLGIMAEKIRAERNNRPLANPRPAPPRTP